jgi:hypothetical protein
MNIKLSMSKAQLLAALSSLRSVEYVLSHTEPARGPGGNGSDERQLPAASRPGNNHDENSG